MHSYINTINLSLNIPTDTHVYSSIKCPRSADHAHKELEQRILSIVSNVKQWAHCVIMLKAIAMQEHKNVAERPIKSPY